MLMMLGLFGFETRSAPYASVKYGAARRWAETPRLGAAPVDQDLGPAAATLTLNGVLRPELTGGPATLARLQAMMDSGKAWVLIAGTGAVMGRYIILSLDQTHSELHGDGRARTIAFTLELRRYVGGADGFGHLPDSNPAAPDSTGPPP